MFIQNCAASVAAPGGLIFFFTAHNRAMAESEKLVRGSWF